MGWNPMAMQEHKDNLSKQSQMAILSMERGSPLLIVSDGSYGLREMDMANLAQVKVING